MQNGITLNRGFWFTVAKYHYFDLVLMTRRIGIHFIVLFMCYKKINDHELHMRALHVQQAMDIHVSMGLGDNDSFLLS